MADEKTLTETQQAELREYMAKHARAVYVKQVKLMAERMRRSAQELENELFRLTDGTLTDAGGMELGEKAFTGAEVMGTTERIQNAVANLNNNLDLHVLTRKAYELTTAERQTF